MRLRQQLLGMAAAAAALIPLSANADSVMNLSAGGAQPGDGIRLGISAVTAGNGNDFPIGTAENPATGGSCTGGICDETTFGAGLITNVIDPSVSGTAIWNGGAVSASNPTGAALAFVIYGIADSSVQQTTPTSGVYNIDNTGSNSASQLVTYTRPSDGATTTVNVGGNNGAIHIDIYSMTAAQAPCFTVGCANEVSVTDRTGLSTVTGITNVGTLWASFTLQSGALPLNPTFDPLGGGTVTLTQNFNFNNFSGTGRGYADCAPSNGCDNFGTSTEAGLGFTAGYAGDPAFATDLVNALFTYNMAAASEPLTNTITGNPCSVPSATCQPNPKKGEAGAGWVLHETDPAYSTTAVPEPASLGLLGTGLAFFGVALHRRRRKVSA